MTNEQYIDNISIIIEEDGQKMLKDKGCKTPAANDWNPDVWDQLKTVSEAPVSAVVK